VYFRVELKTFQFGIKVLVDVGSGTAATLLYQGSAEPRRVSGKNQPHMQTDDRFSIGSYETQRTLIKSGVQSQPHLAIPNIMRLNLIVTLSATGIPV
jgi:hypothetical protein